MWIDLKKITGKDEWVNTSVVGYIAKHKDKVESKVDPKLKVDKWVISAVLLGGGKVDLPFDSESLADEYAGCFHGLGKGG